MGLAYWHTNDEKYAREWCYQLIGWTKKNPRDSEHNYAWRSIEAGIRGYGWTDLFYIYKERTTTSLSLQCPQGDKKKLEFDLSR